MTFEVISHILCLKIIAKIVIKNQVLTYYNKFNTSITCSVLLLLALAAQPNLVLLDEPAAGLDTAESNALGGHLRGLLDHDITVFLIDISQMKSVCAKAESLNS